ncbi:TPA: hypothetical protein ACSVPQ_002798 [Clostridioides difficile]|nr:hypothetical protein [Clostridioides difficile]MBH7168839.1 hypothetical protein [Clostridioides difficile]MBY1346697.1 hypothetical protein [Clostridioides difficile]MCW0912351.1 hypothetical protein [Clostridioides difficile]MDI7827650.1 hypothetical protein [Clostridioides difficile]
MAEAIALPTFSSFCASALFFSILIWTSELVRLSCLFILDCSSLCSLSFADAVFLASYVST